MAFSSTGILESWDGVSTIAQLHAMGEWVQAGSGSGMTLDASGFTGQALKSNNTTNSIYMTIGTLMNGYRFGFRLYVPTIAAGNSDIFHHKGTSAGFAHGVFWRTGAALAWNPQGGTAVTTPDLLTAGAWHQVEGRFIFGNPSGFMEIRVDRIIAASGTRNTSQFVTLNSTAQWVLGARRTDNNDPSNQPCDNGMMIDDFYLVPDADGYQGAVRIQVKRPNGNGNYSQGVGSDGDSTDNYLLVDEQSTNDADYVEFTTDGEKDTYAHSSVTAYTAHTPIALQHVARAAYVGAAVKKLRRVSRRSGTDSTGSDHTLTNALRAYRSTITTDAAGGAFDFTNIDATEFGYEQRP